MQPWSLEAALTGVLLGTAVGDALGLPAENLSAGQIRKRWSGEWRMRFLFGRGMISDDTEHTLMVAQALLSEPEDAAAFQRDLAWRFRWWFAGLPGGVGLATAKACLRLWIGFSPGRSGVVSGGSGPAMRSAIIGAYFANEHDRRRAFVSESSRLTHRGWPAEIAALAVAEAVALAVRLQHSPDAGQVLAVLRGLSDQTKWQALLSRMESQLATGGSVSEFASSLGQAQGVSGYSSHVVPVALFAWLRHSGDFRGALTSALDCGGDTDTVGAILGALAGASVGRPGIPSDWLDGIWDWPRSTALLQRVARRLAQQKQTKRAAGAVKYFWPGVIPRNLLFLAVVLAHGLRRLLAPLIRT